MSNTIKDFRGVIPAVLTVFDRDENFDEQGTREFIRYLLSFNIGGLYLTGSTGEGFLQNSGERNRQVDIVMEEVNGKVPVVVHVGAIGTKETIALAKHAEKAGATGISSVPPFYFKFTEQQILGYYADVAGSTSLPMIVYNIPLAGMMNVETVKKLSEIENVWGIKYTGTALYEETLYRAACKEGFQIYGGCDELGASNMAVGVDGIIGSFYNVIPDLYEKIWDAVHKNDQMTAQKLQKEALEIIMAGLGTGSCMATLKVWLRTAGIPAGYARRPFNNFTPEEEEKQVAQLLEIARNYDTELDIVKRILAK